jgi:GT2 family glycosyltransferase/tetratricopeptide (TPR) repeat protein
MLSFAAMRLRTAARKAARNRDWSAAGDAYRAYLDREPGDAKCWVQYGHVAKESGDWEAAVTAYGRALDAAPDAAETWFHLSHACKRLGDRATAIDCCARAAALDPTFTNATEELVALGARDRIPLGSPGHNRAPILEPDGRVAPDLPLESATYAPSRYDAFRQQITIAPPPAGGRVADVPITVLIDASSALPVEVRSTLSSLLDQSDGRWQAIVQAPPAISDHSVASLAAIDRRIRFVAVDAPLPDAGEAPHVLLVGAGTMLDRQAMAWFSFTVARTGCVAAYCDHDQSVDDWRTGRTFLQPVFHPMFDPDWTPEDGPALLFLDRSRMALLQWRTSDAWKILGDADSLGAVAHLPLLLASRKILPLEAEQAPPDPLRPDSAPASREIAAEDPARQDTLPRHRIQIILQTRDEADMLRACVDSIRRHAAQPELLDITIVDNRSVQPATHRLLDRFKRRKVATVLTLDEPFNWARANNLAAETGTAPLLLFLNNDTEMLTAGWDDMLRHSLSADGVGIVGASLLYPDRTIQHSGIIMGMGGGGPIHEGVGRVIETGPGDRWRKPRSAAAVTGAFLAMRRDVFVAVEGFDALRFAIAFNDIDICLRVRAAGFRVVMASGILMIHHESKTRGMNVTRSQIAWDLDELGRLFDRWGDAIFYDPAYNPHWTRTGQPFDGYRSPSMREVLHHIDLSACATRWAPVAPPKDSAC